MQTCVLCRGSFPFNSCSFSGLHELALYKEQHAAGNTFVYLDSQRTSDSQEGPDAQVIISRAPLCAELLHVDIKGGLHSKSWASEHLDVTFWHVQGGRNVIGFLEGPHVFRV